MKRYFSTIILVVLAMCCLLPSAAYAIENAAGVDIVLVMDCSGSMRRNDPDKLILHGATMVAEMIQADGWRYGAVMFEGHVTGTLPLREVGDDEAVEAIRTELKSVYHQNGRWTDLPRGLSEAIQIFREGGDVGNERVIIALTDGADDPESGRKMDDVDRDRGFVIWLSQEMNVPIYVIGLNVNGTVSQEVNELISNETGAEAFDIATADQIEPTLTAILNRFRKQPAPPEPTPTPSPIPTPTSTPSPTPTATPTPAPTMMPTVDPPQKSLLSGLNLFIAAVLLGVVILVLAILRGYLKSGKTGMFTYRMAKSLKRFITFIRSRRPYLDKSINGFAIEVKNLPYWLKYPRAGELYLEHVKSKRTLQQILTYNWEFTNEYMSAFRDIKWFLTGTEFYTNRKGSLSITVPIHPRFIVQIDDHNQDGPYKGILSIGRELKITLYQNEDNVYEIILGKKDTGSGDSV